MARLIGPINSGTASGSAGSATANFTSGNITGCVLAVYVKYNDSPPAGTTDVTVATAGTASGMPGAVTILALTDGATDGWRYPRVLGDDTAGSDLTGWYVTIPIDDQVKVTIAGADAGDSADVWLMLDY